MEAARRSYDNSRRAAAAGATRERIVEAASELFLSASYDDVALERVAAQAGVSLKTILRQFDSKEGLLLACARRFRDAETGSRAVPPGDVAAVARVLGDRYDEIMDMTRRHLELELRVPAIGEVLRMARSAHWGWLEESFAPHLPRRGSLRQRRIAELFGATEIYVWQTWRRHFGLSRRQAEDALRETLQALIEKWGER